MLVLLLRRAQPDREVSHVDAGIERESQGEHRETGERLAHHFTPRPYLQGEVYEVSGRRAT